MQKNDPGEPGQGQNDAQPGSQSTLGAMKAWMVRWRGSRQLVLVIVAIALLLDNMLLTVVGKSLITDDMLYQRKHSSHVNF
jgi:hypothetical protein